MFPPTSAQRFLMSDKRTLSLLHQPRRLSARELRRVHAHLVVSGAISDPYAAGKLVALCCAGNDLGHAALVFRHLPKRSSFIWNTIIEAHVQSRWPLEALELYKQMLGSGFLPNNYTFSFALRACIDLSSLPAGRELHAKIVELGWELYDFVQNGLIHMYSSCGCLDSARKLFDGSSVRDVITWTAMVTGYAKAGRIDAARQLFDQMPERNSVSWSAIITMYVQFGKFNEALELFNEMQLGGIQPNHAGIVCALSACGSLGALDQGRWIHVFVKRNRMELDRILGTALIDMYAKCGCIELAWKVFEEMPERDVYAFTSIISGLSNHGQCREAMALFDRMQFEEVRPNEVTFICILSVCGRMGWVNRGREIFESMDRIYQITPGVEHYGCFVDLLGRAGLVEQAKRVIKEMPIEPDSYVLGALLNACGMHGELNAGKETVDVLKELGIDHSGVHALMSNMYASALKWQNVIEARKEMDERNVIKVPGCSMLEVDGVICKFVAGDRSHVEMDTIRSIAINLDKQLKSSEDALVFEERI